MSTITLNLSEAGAVVAETKAQSTLARAWERAVGAALAVVSAGIVMAGALLPILIALALLLVLIRLVRPRLTPEP
jgi:hypothetical protein